jgi:hypothetical protein
MLTVLMQNVVMLSVVCAKCHHTDIYYDELYYAESCSFVQYACAAILNVVLLCLVNAQFRN